MAETINHICFNELTDLEDNSPEGHYHLLIVGTFNPEIKKNKAKWFYGRGESEFWFLLPRMMNLPSLHPADNDNLDDDSLLDGWQLFTKENSILIIDLFKSVEAKIIGFKDNEFNDPEKSKVNPLNFENVLKSLSFDAVLFTYLKPKNKKCNIYKFQEELKKVLIEKGKTKVIDHLYSPSQLSRGGRRKKLDQWRGVYNKVKIATFKTTNE